MLKGRTEPRIFTPPARELTRKTSLGFQCIDFAREVLDIQLYPWQEFLLKHALELNEDGTFRFRKIFVLVARQNGKSTLLQVLSLWRMFLGSGKLVLGTAQDRSLAREQWLGAVEMAQGVQDLTELIEDVSLSRGFEKFSLSSGEQYKIAASNRRAGRGLSVDLLLLDEIREHQSWDTWAAVSKTTNARPKGQIWAVSNAGDASSIVLRHFRQVTHRDIGDPDGLSRDPITGEIKEYELPEGADESDGSVAVFEWSAPPGCSVWDKDGWAQANPSLGYGAVTERTLVSDAKNDPEWVFRTEVLCQWFNGSSEGPFPAGSWNAGLDEESLIDTDSFLVAGIDVSWDRSTSHIVYAGYRPDGKIHVESVARRYGTDWIRSWLTSPERSRLPDLLVWQTNGAPVSSLAEDFYGTGIPCKQWASSDLGKASGIFYDLVRSSIAENGDVDKTKVSLFHRSQPVLDIAVNTGVVRPAGDAWIWDRAKSPSDISPLIAATAAVWGLTTGDKMAKSVYEDFDLMILD